MFLTVIGKTQEDIHHAIVDDDQEHLARYRWRLKKGYVARKYGGKHIYLHQTVLGERPEGLVGDHINRDVLDNRRANLCWITRAENAQNRGLNANNVTGHRGVSYVLGRYRADVYLNGKCHYLGVFSTAEEAGRAASDFRSKHMPYSGMDQCYE